MNVRLSAIGTAVLLSLTISIPSIAADENGISRIQADTIISELRQIRQLLEQSRPSSGDQPSIQQQPQKVVLKQSGERVLGNHNAPVTIVAFTDYQCPFCQRFHMTTFSEIKKEYIDTGKVRFYSRSLPLDMHPNASIAAEAARCAGEQGQFWEMHDVLSRNASKLGQEEVMKYAKDLKVDLEVFQRCLTSGKYKKEIDQDVTVAGQVGARGTPSFVLGKTNGEGVEGELVVGALPYTVFDGKIRQVLASTDVK